METTRYCKELNAVEVEEPALPQGLEISRPGDLPSFQVFHLYTDAEGKMYIPFMQYIFDSQ